MEFTEILLYRKRESKARKLCDWLKSKYLPYPRKLSWLVCHWLSLSFNLLNPEAFQTNVLVWFVNIGCQGITASHLSKGLLV